MNKINMVNLKTKNKFGTQVKEYDKYRTEYSDEFYDSLFILAKTDVKDILDIGCGTGKTTEKLARKDIKVVGYDHDSKMLNQAKENAKKRNLPIKYIKGKAEELPFEDNSFDIITIGNAFHWFANKEAVKNIYRVLRPNGLLFIHWKQIGKEDIKLRRKIFRQFNPEYNGSGILITPEKCMELLGGQSFQGIKHVNKKYTFGYNFESAIGRLKTLGNYFSLSLEQKIEFERIAKKEFSDYFDGKSKIEFTSTTRIIYAYKK